MIHILGLSLAAGLALSSIAAAPPHSAITRSAVDLRSAASPHALVLARIPKSHTVRVQACAREWCSVTSRRRQGFVPQASLAERRDRQPSAPCGREHYRNTQGQCIHSPDGPRDGQPPLNSTARCWDGKFSHGTDPHGRCSSHGGTPDAGATRGASAAGRARAASARS